MPPETVRHRGVTRSDPVNTGIVSGAHRWVTARLIRLHIVWIALTFYRSPTKAFRALKSLMEKRRSIQGDFPILRYAKAGGRYYWSLAAPGWPSVAFKSFIQNELSRLDCSPSRHRHLQTIVFAVTRKCPLRCSHCFAWETLDTRDTLTLQDLQAILEKFQGRGVDVVQLSGGEPLSRFDDTLELLRCARAGTDFWLLTCGFGLTPRRAVMLRQAGLAGVNIGLDHWDEERHNAFRGHERSFFWATEAARSCRTAGLAVCFELCALRDFVTTENLWRYVRLARQWGAGFVRILEPRKVGRFAGQDVELDGERIEVLKKFYLAVNSDTSYRNLPIVMYPGYHQRTHGCFGAGNRYLYVDANGGLHACPFCQGLVGNALTGDIDAAMREMQRVGCHKFKSCAFG